MAALHSWKIVKQKDESKGVLPSTALIVSTHSHVDHPCSWQEAPKEAARYNFEVGSTAAITSTLGVKEEVRMTRQKIMAYWPPLCGTGEDPSHCAIMGERMQETKFCITRGFQWTDDPNFKCHGSIGQQIDNAGDCRAGFWQRPALQVIQSGKADKVHLQD